MAQDNFFLISLNGRWGPIWVHSARRRLIVLLYLLRVTVRMEYLVEWSWQGKPMYLGKTCPNATLSTTNPTWSDQGSNPGNPGRRGGKPAANRLSCGEAVAQGRCPYSARDHSFYLETRFSTISSKSPVNLKSVMHICIISSLKMFIHIIQINKRNFYVNTNTDCVTTEWIPDNIRRRDLTSADICVDLAICYA
jgi:hypothetical protein